MSLLSENLDKLEDIALELEQKGLNITSKSIQDIVDEIRSQVIELVEKVEEYFE